MNTENASKPTAPTALIAPPESALIAAQVANALHEDVGGGDLTASLLPRKAVRAYIMAREEAVLCGQAWVEEAMRQCDPSISVRWLLAEGARTTPNAPLVWFEGPAPALLTAERTALNFMQLLSGVASKTARFVELVRGTKAAIVDTRKTIPGLRLAQKYAVLVGGGVNHRIGLYDAVLIKENHIATAGGVQAALAAAVANAPQAQFIEIEVERLEQLKEALDAGAKMVLLDNMDIPTLTEAVRLNRSYGEQAAILEISGGVNESSVRALAETGVDRISIGGLTKDVKATDFSMRLEGL